MTTGPAITLRQWQQQHESKRIQTLDEELVRTPVAEIERLRENLKYATGCLGEMGLHSPNQRDPKQDAEIQQIR